MAQNHGSRARPWANLPLPNGPWAPLVAIAAVLATVALVANGPRIGGESPSVPDGRAYSTADRAPAGALDRTAPEEPEGEPLRSDRDPADAPPSKPRPRRRAPAASHRRRRSAPPRSPAPSARGRRSAPGFAPRADVPAPATPTPTPAHADPVVRRAPTPHRGPISSAEREFGL